MATKVRKVRKKVDRIDESELHSSLEKLNLSENPIACIPSAISVCSNLTKLVLRNCRLQELPSELGECRALTTIDVSGNELTRLPPELATLEKLSTLDVRSNQIKVRCTVFEPLTAASADDSYGVCQATTDEKVFCFTKSHSSTS